MAALRLRLVLFVVFTGVAGTSLVGLMHAEAGGAELGWSILAFSIVVLTLLALDAVGDIRRAIPADREGEIDRPDAGGEVR